MTTRVPRAFGICGVTAAAIALAAWGYTICLPYRLSSFQHQCLPLAVGVQIIMSFAAMLGGFVARITGGRRIGLVAMLSGLVALLLAISTAHIHSTSPGISRHDLPNQTLETNRRPASPLGTSRQFERAVHAQTYLSGGGRSALRSAKSL